MQSSSRKSSFPQAFGLERVNQYWFPHINPKYMQFSDTTNKNGIIQLIESLCKLDDGDITNDSTLLKVITAFVNQGYSEMVEGMMEVDKHWKWDDFNYSDYPESPITMVASQRDYSLPVAIASANAATLLRINRVWVLDQYGKRHELTKMKESDDFDYTNTGLPTRYRLHGKSIFLDLRPSAAATTLTNGLLIQYQRIYDAFTSADTTQQPGFKETYHDLLALYAAYRYLAGTDPDLSKDYYAQFLARLEKLKTSMAQGDDNTPRRITPNTENTK